MASTYDEGHFIEVLDALHSDQTGLADALNRIKRIVEGYSWIAEGGRGSYEYDDDEYYQEIGRCFDAIVDEIDVSLHESGRKAHQICCDKYRSIRRHHKVPTQRRLRAAQPYTEFVDEMMDYILIEREDV